MDRRILKTRKLIKRAFLSLLEEKPFEKITVKEICERSETGRVTFYNHYEDKTDLMDDCLRDMEIILQERYDELQQENNPDNELEKSLRNMIEIVIWVDKKVPEERLKQSSDMRNFYYQFVMDEMKNMEARLGIETRYDNKQLNGFLVMGAWGFLHGNNELSEDQIREYANYLIKDLIESNIFQKKEE
jgi:AcrR family transcriptional regulator